MKKNKNKNIMIILINLIHIYYNETFFIKNKMLKKIIIALVILVIVIILFIIFDKINKIIKEKANKL